MTDDLIEVMAKAVREARNPYITPPTNGTAYDEFISRAVLSALESAGYVVVSRAAVKRIVRQEIPEWAQPTHPVMLAFNGSWQYDEADCRFTVADLKAVRKAMIGE